MTDVNATQFLQRLDRVIKNGRTSHHVALLGGGFTVPLAAKVDSDGNAGQFVMTFWFNNPKSPRQFFGRTIGELIEAVENEDIRLAQEPIEVCPPKPAKAVSLGRKPAALKKSASK